MRGKRAALVAGVCATVAMGAVDTLKVKNMFQLWQTNQSNTVYRLHSLGAVHNGIIYGNMKPSSSITTNADDVLIWDANVATVDGGGNTLYGYEGFKGRIDRPGSNFDGTFPMKLKGDTLIYTDSTDLIAALVTDPANPVQLWKKTFPAEIKNINWTNTDTFYVSDTRVNTAKGFSVTEYKGNVAPVVLDSLTYMHTGFNSFISDTKYIRFSTTAFSTWNKPFTSRMYDGYFAHGKSILSAATQGNYSYCTNGSKIYVYDHTNMSAFALKDSAVGGYLFNLQGVTDRRWGGWGEYWYL